MADGYYQRRGNQLTLGRRWTPEDKASLKELAATTPPKLIARKLDRSCEAIRQIAARHGIRFLVERSKQEQPF